MSFSIDQKIFKNIIDSVKEIVPKNKNNIQEIRLLVDEHGLTITTTNAEETIYAVAYLDSAIFAEYKITSDNYIDLNLDDLRKLLSTSDIITITFKKANEICLNFGKKVKSSYTIKSIDTSIEHKIIDLSEFTYDLTFTIDSSLFKQIITRITNHSDTCKIFCDTKELKFIVDSNTVTAEEIIELSDLEFVSEQTELGLIKISTTQLCSILKTNVLSDKIKVQLSTDSNEPICIVYEKENSYMKYLICKMAVDAT
jgi:hypothetical protein